jgi:hypothetical protein
MVQVGSGLQVSSVMVTVTLLPFQRDALSPAHLAAVSFSPATPAATWPGPHRGPDAAD